MFSDLTNREPVKKYDAIVIGAGAGGGVVACLLAEAGKSVLLLERGPDPTFEQVGRDHLRNQRLSYYGHNAGPDRNHPRVVENGQTVLPWQGAYHANAALVGGGTRVYGAQAWRFHPLDFKMASTYGVPEGSSLADWPIDFNDMAPFYERVEHELGVCGDASKMVHLPPYRKDYPMPPQMETIQAKAHRKGAEKLGWNWLPVPLGINSVPYQDRPACIRCQHCVGFACPNDSKNGTHNTFIPRALATGNCELLDGAMVQKIHLSGGTATGVTYHYFRDEYEATAETIIVAGGAIETARLLMLSGVKNEHLGRHLQGHVYVGATALFPEDIYDGQGPGVTTATTQWSHNNEGIVGGGMLADEFIILPVMAWKRHLPPGVPQWGLEAKHWMRDNYKKLSDVKGPVQEIPSPDGRVTLDPSVTDAWGTPVARLSGTTHPETIRTGQFLQKKAVEWLEASGGTQIWGGPPATPYLSGGQHQAGTCRMSNTPDDGVVNPRCRVHGYTNLYVADTSPHVTNGGFNPFLTAMALAYRIATGILQDF